MKHFILFCFFNTSLFLSAQIVINPNPVDINSGILTITYGSQGDYSLFDPMGDPNLLLYTGLQTDADPLTWDYHDDFSDTNTFVVFNFDTTLNAYVAQIDVAGRMYQEEPSLNVVNLPANTVVNDWYFIIATTDLSRQSADLKGSDYGWQAATLSNKIANKDLGVKAVKNVLLFSKKEFYEIELYDLTGRLVLKINRRMEEDYLEILTMQPKTFYIIKISGLQGQQVFKHYFL
ncbi:hypothetical protein [Nonlabens ulvanivorans]|uniref:hypothetical protein n=1 Tax=Nonlabens ulvanivorans TaxID=906888 RepID=UPI002941DFB3|nr:hypothetical protein [Nonlabens ulvanivorans]WOI24110.1 hypothetical protein R1T42_06575 [Nonlabens ulvanivorans]